jgi:hypothetical protein
MGSGKLLSGALLAAVVASVPQVSAAAPESGDKIVVAQARPSPFKRPAASAPAADGTVAAPAADPAAGGAAPAAPRGRLPFGRPGAPPAAATQPAGAAPAVAKPAAVTPAAPPDDVRVLPDEGLANLRPLGYTGTPGAPGIAARNAGPGTGADGGRINPNESGFLPIPDRWRVGLPPGYIQNTRGNILDPYGQNVLKGDYALPGTQDLFLIVNLVSDTLVEARRTPTPSDVSSIGPGKFEFFGVGDSQFVIQNFVVSAEIFKGNPGYRPKDWSLKFTGVENLNYVDVNETTAISPDPREGADRFDEYFGFQELFGEVKLADLSPNFDFVSVRAGIQGFNSDFRGFLFNDNELGIRLFGNYDNNRIQYNLAYFKQLEKDTNSGLNTLSTRAQDVFIANVFRQDFIWEGYTAQLSFHANIDRSSGLRYDENGFLVRPAPVATIATKDVNAFYFGWAGDGHIGRMNITHQFYQAVGNESFNQIAAQRVNINAQLAAVELSIDYDYLRYRASFLYLSGDDDPFDGHAKGFDTIFDNPNFAGGGFSYFTRQAIRLTGSGVGLVGRNSFTPSLRTSKEQGQANFVNPGLFLYNVGVDVDVTPTVKLITNASYLQFADTSSLQAILQDGKIAKEIGYDLSVGIEYRPLLNNNVILTVGAAALIPGNGFKDIYTSETLYSTFVALTLTY